MKLITVEAQLNGRDDTTVISQYETLTEAIQDLGEVEVLNILNKVKIQRERVNWNIRAAKVKNKIIRYKRMKAMK